MIGIKIDQGQIRRVVRAIKRVEDTIRIQAKEIPRKSAIEYAANVIKAISTQKYGWAGLSKKYIKRKAKAGADPRIWVLSGDLLRAISYRWLSGKVSKVGIEYQFFSGIFGSKQSTGAYWTKSKQILDYAWSMEKGWPGRNQPARPVFEPEFILFKGVTKLKLARAKGLIRRAWR